MRVRTAIEGRRKVNRARVEGEQRAPRCVEDLAFNVPVWLEPLDINYLQPMAIRKDPEFIVFVNGDLDTVKALQRATGVLLKRFVSKETGKVHFHGEVKDKGCKFHVTVVGDDLPLAPCCELVPYAETVTRFKVVCPEQAEHVSV